MDDEDYEDLDERKSLEITVQDVAPMYGSLLTVQDTPHDSRQILTKNWWRIARKLYPELHTKIYCVPPVHFNAVSYKVRSEQPTLQEPYESFGMRMFLPMQYSNIRDDEAQQRVLRTVLAFLERNGRVAFVLSNVEFQNYLNKKYEVDEGVVDLPKLAPEDEGEIDVMVIDKTYGIFVLEVKATGYRADIATEETLRTCASPIAKATRQLPKNAAVLRFILSDLDPHQMIKIRTGVLMPNLNREILRNILDSCADISEMFMNAIGARNREQLLHCCLCSDGFPPANSSALEENFHIIDRFWSTLETVTGKMIQAINDETYEQLVARFCGHLSTVKIYTEKSMPRVRLETIPPRKKDAKRRSRNAKPSKIKVIPFECRTIAGAAREVARRFSELVLLPEQIDLLQQREDFVHLEGPPGTGKTLMLLLRVLTWLDGNNMVWMLSLAPSSRSIIRVMHEQVKQMLHEHKGREAAEAIIKKRLRIFIMTRPEKTLDAKYFERRLHKWRLRAKLKDSDINWGYPQAPTLPSVAPHSDRKVCLVLYEAGVSGRGSHDFFNQVSLCQRSGCFTSGDAGFTAGLSVWSASLEKCGRPCYARDLHERETEDKFGIYRQLWMPLRCPPSIQRALMLVQPDLDHNNVFTFHKDYLLPNPLAGHNSEFKYQYPADGLPVHLIAHGGHKKADQPIWLCWECGEDLAAYLKGTLRIGASTLPPDDFILVLDKTSTHGLERAVVVVVPEHPGPAQPTQAFAVTSTTSALCANDLEMDGGEDVSPLEKTNTLCLERTHTSYKERPCPSNQEATLTSCQKISPEGIPTSGGKSIQTEGSDEQMVGKPVRQLGCWNKNTSRNLTLRDDFDIIEEDTDPPYSKSTDVDIELMHSGEVANCADQCTHTYTTRTTSSTVDVSTELAVDSSQSPRKKTRPSGQDGVTGATTFELSAPDGASERRINEALRTLTPAARRDIFFIGSRATCQLIVFHFGKR